MRFSPPSMVSKKLASSCRMTPRTRSIVSDNSFDLPDGAAGPGHIIWLPDGGLLVSCNTTDNMVIVPPVTFP